MVINVYNFFVAIENKMNNRYFLGGKDYNHIKNVLRMAVGDTFLVSCEGKSDLCEIEGFDIDRVIARIIEPDFQNTNLPVNIHIFQGLPKSDKLEFIIQKSVELGVASVTPVSMKRSIMKIDEKKKKAKCERWQSIAEAAAKQSKRTSIPKVNEVISFKEMLKIAQGLDLFLVPYECAEGMSATKQALSEIKPDMDIGILIGPEGGFDQAEIEFAVSNGGKVISLGSRILRCETAAVTAAAMCMLYCEMEL